MRIAIVGYGSLLWDLENLAPHITGKWHMGAGPLMPVEFSRISPKRKKALVLNIDELLTHQCKTSIIASRHNTFADAINSLAARERCKEEMVGFCSVRGDAHKAIDGVETWLEKSVFDGVIWTSLPGNFHSETGKAFDHQTARDYLASLSEEPLGEAHRYIEFAPEITDTPFRRFLKSDPFWQNLGKLKG